MITAIATLKKWFANFKKPTQEQFWAWLDSFWHKNEKIPMTSIDGLDKIIENSLSTSQFNNHLEDNQAHISLFNKKVDKQTGQTLSSNDFTDELKQKLENLQPIDVDNITKEDKIQLTQSYDVFEVNNTHKQKDFNSKVAEKTKNLASNIRQLETQLQQEQTELYEQLADNKRSIENEKQVRETAFSNLPNTFADKTHTHSIEDITDLNGIEIIYYTQDNGDIEYRIGIQHNSVKNFEQGSILVPKSLNEFDVRNIVTAMQSSSDNSKKENSIIEISDKSQMLSLNNYDNKVLIFNNEQNININVSGRNYSTTFVKGNGKGKIVLSEGYPSVEYTIDPVKGNLAKIYSSTNIREIRIFDKYPYSIIKSSKFVTLTDPNLGTLTSTDIGKSAYVSVMDNFDFDFVLFKENKPDYTKNKIKINFNKSSFTKREDNLMTSDFFFAGIILTTDDVYTPNSKHNVFVSNSNYNIGGENVTDEVIIDVAGKQNYNIFYLIYVTARPNAGGFASMGSLNLTLTKGFLSYL